jgi:hypothetical protein
LRPGLTTTLLLALALALPAAQSNVTYRRVEGWAPAPGGTSWGQVQGMAIDGSGRLFVFRRGEPPVVELDGEGRVLKT